jgi:hypothetical protein
MQLYKTFKPESASCKVRDLWVTDFVLMSNVNKIAVAYTSKELSKYSFYLLKEYNNLLFFCKVIYETTSKLEFSLAYRIVGIDATPYCLDFW